MGTVEWMGDMLRLSKWPEQKFIIKVPQKTLARGYLRNFILCLSLMGVQSAAV